MVNLIKSVTEKMKGFSRKETIAYYQDIVNKAWVQVQQAATPEVKAQVYEEVMDWTMLDKNTKIRLKKPSVDRSSFPPLPGGGVMIPLSLDR